LPPRRAASMRRLPTPSWLCAVLVVHVVIPVLAEDVLTIDIGSTSTRFCYIEQLPTGGSHTQEDLGNEVSRSSYQTKVICYEANKTETIDPENENLSELLNIRDGRGISSFVSTLEEANTTTNGTNSKGWVYLYDALDTTLPKNIPKDVPVLLYATAGIRDRFSIRAQRALEHVMHITLEKFGFTKVVKTSIMPGPVEGIYAWWAVNYVLDRLNSCTYDVIEFGGQSVQLVRKLDPYMSWNDNSVTLGFKKEQYFVQSYHNWGAEATWKRFKAGLKGGINPCMVEGLPDEENRIGISNPQECRDHIKALFFRDQKGCTAEDTSILEEGGKYLPPPLSRQTTVVLGQMAGGIRNSVEKLWKWAANATQPRSEKAKEGCAALGNRIAPMLGDLNRNHQALLRDAAFCACSLNVTETKTVLFNEKHATRRCFGINYLQLMTSLAFGLRHTTDTSAFAFQLGVKRYDQWLSWPLGAAVHYSLWPTRWTRQSNTTTAPPFCDNPVGHNGLEAEVKIIQV
jgi:hypothetical protein